MVCVRISDVEISATRKSEEKVWAARKIILRGRRRVTKNGSDYNTTCARLSE